MRYCSEKTSLEMNPPLLSSSARFKREMRERGGMIHNQGINCRSLGIPDFPLHFSLFFTTTSSCVCMRGAAGVCGQESKFGIPSDTLQTQLLLFLFFPSFLLQWPYCTRGDTSSLAEETYVVQLDLFTAQELSGDTQTPLPFSRKLLALLPFLGVSFWCIRHNKSRKHPFCPLFYRQKREKNLSSAI